MFDVSLLARLRRAPTPPRPPRRAGAEPVAGDETPAACGWFDSSHELRRGLVVVELGDAALDALALERAVARLVA